MIETAADRAPQRALAEAAIAACLAGLLFSLAAASLPLIGQDEARFAQAAREMAAAGEWVVPSFAGEPRYDKPILIYWLMMASSAVFGVSAFAARMPSVTAGAVLAGLLVYEGRRRGLNGPLVGALFAACPLVFVESCAATADLVMLLPTVVAMFALERLWFRAQSGAGTAALFWTAMALSVLAKGPVGPAVAAAAWAGLWALEHEWTRHHVVAALVLLTAGYLGLGPLVSGVAFGAAALSRRGRERVKALRPHWGVPLLLTLVLPWAVAAHLRTEGAYFASAIGRHVVERGLQPLEGHGGFPGFYALSAILLALPWLALLVARFGSFAVWVRDRESRFLLAWMLGPLVMFEVLQTRMVHYWMPSYAAGALLAVWCLGRGVPVSVPGRGAGRVVLAAGAAALAALPFAAVVVFDLDPLLPRAVAAALPMVAVGLLAVRAGFTTETAWAAAALSAVFVVGVTTVFLPGLSRFTIVPRTLEAVAGRPDADQLVVYRLRHDEVMFSLPVTAVVDRSPEALDERVASRGAVRAVAERRDLDAWATVYPEHRVEVEAEIRGVDLSRGRWTETVIVRVEAR